MSAARILAAEARALGRELRGLLREARAARPRPPRRGLVLEVGAGQAPHPRSDLVVDKYPADSFERAGEAGLSLAKPLVVGDAEALPFVDGAAEYAIARHVLEHATDPERFAAELARVAAAGFVQVPTRWSELTFGWPYHPWLIDRRGDVLLFAPKGEQRAPIGEELHALYAESPLTKLWWGAHRSRWHASLEWRGRLQVEVQRGGIAERTASVDVEATLAAVRGADGPTEAQRALLRCPACRGALAASGERLACADCDRAYPLGGEVPVLLVEAAA